MNALPSVETAWSILQQEELQREVLEEEQSIHKASKLYSKGHVALFSKTNEERCGHCGNKGHTREKCWQLIGYPHWHPKGRKSSQKQQPKELPRMPKGRTATHVESTTYKSTKGGISLTSQQIEQSLRLLPQPSRASSESEEDELQQSFANSSEVCASPVSAIVPSLRIEEEDPLLFLSRLWPCKEIYQRGKKACLARRLL
ncbi:hypothetical protein Cgig2_011543 [Carnegiea gigantea]|uniref:CCHC-type domain-containing protein n=1 Tax=Carnegiea gigantea TaxID=171969 RepID=A0A9Q1K314_9CARY|nr:hypothetical protein Cgig2_011543 [Carnegiea gigantea]